MKLCIPTLDDGGARGRLSPHFGSAPYFTLVDLETGELQVVENRHSHHEHGSCEPSAALKGHAVGTVICPGLGRRAFARLKRAGIVVYVSDEDDVSAALAAFRTGKVRRLTAEEACHGGRRHAHSHRLS